MRNAAPPYRKTACGLQALRANTLLSVDHSLLSMDISLLSTDITLLSVACRVLSGPICAGELTSPIRQTSFSPTPPTPSTAADSRA